MQDEWGITVFGRLEIQRAKAREKKRRQRAMVALRQPPKPMRTDNPTWDVFETCSGMLAVRSRFLEAPVSLPYVPFLHGRTLREAR